MVQGDPLRIPKEPLRRHGTPKMPRGSFKVPRRLLKCPGNQIFTNVLYCLLCPVLHLFTVGVVFSLACLGWWLW